MEISLKPLSRFRGPLLTEGAVRGWLLTFVPRYKSGGSTGMGVSHAGARRPTGALGVVNRAYRYRPSGRRDGSLYAGTDLMVTLRLLRPAKSPSASPYRPVG